MMLDATDAANGCRVVALWLDAHPEVDGILSVYVWASGSTTVHVTMDVYARCTALGSESRKYIQSGYEHIHMEVAPGIELTACRVQMEVAS